LARGNKEPVARQGDRLLQIDASRAGKALGDRASEFPSAKLTFMHTHPGLNPGRFGGTEKAERQADFRCWPKSRH
jgi:hypothetical protein